MAVCESVGRLLPSSPRGQGSDYCLVRLPSNDRSSAILDGLEVQRRGLIPAPLDFYTNPDIFYLRTKA